MLWLWLGFYFAVIMMVELVVVVWRLSASEHQRPTLQKNILNMTRADVQVKLNTLIIVFTDTFRIMEIY